MASIPVPSAAPQFQNGSKANKVRVYAAWGAFELSDSLEANHNVNDVGNDDQNGHDHDDGQRDTNG